MIYTIRTTVGRENAVMETLTSKIKNTNANIKCILHPAELKGYIFIEGTIEEIEKIIGGIPNVRGLIAREVQLPQIKHFLEVKKLEIKIAKGDIIEIVGGPFKNEKGKIIRVDKAKEEVTIELLEAAIPIPITIAIESVKLIESAEKAE